MRSCRNTKVLESQIKKPPFKFTPPQMPGCTHPKVQALAKLVADLGRPGEHRGEIECPDCKGKIQVDVKVTLDQ